MIKRGDGMHPWIWDWPQGLAGLLKWMVVLLMVSCVNGASLAEPPGNPEVGEGSWSIQARIAESCCCAPICPCMVGSPPTLGHCVGHRLVEITAGHYGAVSLSGLDLIITFRVGEWTRLHVSNRASKEQTEALEKILNLQGGFVFGEIREVKPASIRVERDSRRILFETADTKVAMEVMSGVGGDPIQVLNLSSWRGYTQYKSTAVSHTSSREDEEFDFSGTSGFSALYEATSS
jgi:hypothetical protein